MKWRNSITCTTVRNRRLIQFFNTDYFRFTDSFTQIGKKWMIYQDLSEGFAKRYRSIRNCYENDQAPFLGQQFGGGNASLCKNFIVIAGLESTQFGLTLYEGASSVCQHQRKKVESGFVLQTLL